MVLIAGFLGPSCNVENLLLGEHTPLFSSMCFRNKEAWLWSTFLGLSPAQPCPTPSFRNQRDGRMQIIMNSRGKDLVNSEPILSNFILAQLFVVMDGTGGGIEENSGSFLTLLKQMLVYGMPCILQTPCLEIAIFLILITVLGVGQTLDLRCKQQLILTIKITDCTDSSETFEKLKNQAQKERRMDQLLGSILQEQTDGSIGVLLG